MITQHTFAIGDIVRITSNYYGSDMPAGTITTVEAASDYNSEGMFVRRPGTTGNVKHDDLLFCPFDQFELAEPAATPDEKPRPLMVEFSLVTKSGDTIEGACEVITFGPIVLWCLDRATVNGVEVTGNPELDKLANEHEEVLEWIVDTTTDLLEV